MLLLILAFTFALLFLKYATGGGVHSSELWHLNL